MLQTNLQKYQKVADILRRHDPPEEIIYTTRKHLLDLRLEREFSEELGHENRAEFAGRAFQVLARGLADSCCTSVKKIHQSLDDAVEREKRCQTRGEKIDALQETGEARMQVAFDQPIKN